jgi:hypothetical protein
MLGGMKTEFENDCSQKKRWEEFMIADHAEEGDCNLLQAMEMLDDEGQITLEAVQELDVLGEEIVDIIIEMRGCNVHMGTCENSKKTKSGAWGPILVERPRRRQGYTWNVMQKAMEIKKKRNLEPLKGNSFAA